ncbi:MAG: DNA polymerase III subunit delta [Gammaproteobacteria bacterium]|nr:MAG: DNA polymerase III subunit delta [Gammaproteobacteria bacterium]
MKLTYFQLEAQLAKKLLPVYIVSGEELLLKQDAIQWIRQTAQQAGFHERIRLNADEAEANQLYTLLHSSSLLAEKQLIELDCRQANPNKTLTPILQEYGSHPSPHHLLLIDIGKIDDKIAKSAWYTALEKIGANVAIWPIPREQLPTWITQRAKKYPLTLKPDAAHLLAEYVEGNLIAAANALEKIYLLAPTSPIDASLIQTLLTDESHFTVFDFIENMLAGDLTRTLHILENLRAEGTEPVLVLWAITRELRLLAEMAEQLKQGATYEALFQKQRIFARRQTAMRRFLTHFSATDCWQYLTRAADIDRVIKGVAPGDVWDSLRMFCLGIIYNKNNS